MKKIFYILLTIILFLTLNVKASTNTYERTEENGYGVKKETDYQDKLNSIKKTKYVDASEKIYDFSGILSDEEEKELKIKIDEFISKTNMDLVIVTDELPYTNDSDNETYAEDFYDYNDFGLGTKHYDGIILFRNTYRANPYYIMTLTGEAQFYYHTRIDDILDEIYPNIKSGNYKQAFSDFIYQLNGYYDRGIPDEMKEYDLDETGHLIKVEKEEDKEYKPPIVVMIISAILGTSIFTGVNVKKNKMVTHEYDADNYLDHNTINYSKVIDKFVSTFTTSHRISSSSSGGGGFSSHTGSSGFGHSSGGRHG